MILIDVACTFDATYESVPVQQCPVFLARPAIGLSLVVQEANAANLNAFNLCVLYCGVKENVLPLHA